MKINKLLISASVLALLACTVAIAQPGFPPAQVQQPTTKDECAVWVDSSQNLVKSAPCGGSGSTGANPTATIGASAVNGSATTYLRSDGAPALPAILPALSGVNLTSLNATNLGSGAVPAARMPALTGDITTSAGAIATTLATVNANVGTFGDATHCANFTVNGKGLITAAAQSVSCPGGGGGGSVSITSLSNNLVVTPSPLTGTGTISSTYLQDPRTTTTETITSANAGEIVTGNNGGAQAFTLPGSNSGGGFSAGYSTEILEIGAGALTPSSTSTFFPGAPVLAKGQSAGFTSLGATGWLVDAVSVPFMAQDTVLGNAAAANYPTALALPSCANDGAHASIYAAHAWACAAISGGSATSVTVGITTVGSGTDTKVLFDQAGVLGEYSVSGTGNVPLSASPTFTGTISAAGLTLSSTLTTNVTGSTQCLHVNTSGVVSGTGSDCGAGGGGSPGGSGTELQFRGGASTFSALTNSATTTTGLNLGSTVAPVSALDIDQAALSWWNTTDHVTNFDQAKASFVANVFTLATSKGGTGTARAITITSGAGLAINAATGTSISLQNAGTLIFSVNGSGVISNNAAGPEMIGQAASATAPTFAPNKASLTTGIGAQASGNMSFIAGGAEIARVTGTSLTQIAGQTVLKGYTVAGLPTGITGGMAYVTDAVACTFAAGVTGGGSAYCPVTYNGASWQAL